MRCVICDRPATRVLCLRPLRPRPGRPRAEEKRRHLFACAVCAEDLWYAVRKEADEARAMVRKLGEDLGIEQKEMPNE